VEVVRVRLVVVAATLAVLVTLAVGWIAPATNGDLGIKTAPITPMQQRIVAVAPDSPFAAAGGRPGDVVRLDRMSPAQRVAFAWLTAGTPLELSIDRAGREIDMQVVPLQSSGNARSWRDVGIVAFTLLYMVIALLVTWKAQRSRAASLIVAFLIGLALSGGIVELRSVLPSPGAKLSADVVDALCICALLFSQFFFALTFPPRESKLRSWTLRVGVPVVVLVMTTIMLGVFQGILPIVTNTFVSISNSLSIAFSLLTIVAVVDGFLNGAREYRVPTVAAGSTLILLALMNLVDFGGALFGWDTSWLQPFSWLRYATGIGMAYAVLRHRLVDLNVVVSRAAIFSVVSVCVVALFVVVEWALSLILERAIGPQFGPQSESTLAIIVALGVGVSARSIHGVVNHRLNRLFFARRYRALAELRRYALETDAATSAEPLVDLTLAVLRRNLDAKYVEMYAGDPTSGYEIVRGSGATAPPRLGPDEEIVLRLRRWTEAFVVEVSSDPFAGALICPMILRGTVYGFVVCGPKRDHSSYLPDEIETLVSLTHRVGIAYEWLTRDRPLRSLSPVRLKPG
jgi:hypothetical protein